MNTTDSKAELVCDVARAGLGEAVTARVIAALGEHVRVVVSTERSQIRNRAEALVRLGALIPCICLRNFVSFRAITENCTGVPRP